MLIIRLVINILFLVLLFFIISPLHALSYNVIFSDDFTDGNDIGWEKHHNYGPINTTTMWNVRDQQYGMRVETSGTSGDSYAGDLSWTDYRFEFDMLPITGADKNFIFRYRNPQHYEIHISGNRIYLSSYIMGVLDFKDITIVNGVKYNWQIEVVKERIIVRYKKADDPNFVTIFDIKDSVPILNGKIGLRIGTGATYPSEVYFDNVVVTDLREPTEPEPTATPEPTETPAPTESPEPTQTPEPTQSPEPTATPEPDPTPFNLNVDFYSQRDAAWGGEKYDHAEKWAPKNKRGIKDWGCALTSAVMALRHHGFLKGPQGQDTNPLTVNEYLKNNKGYNNYGYIVWSAITQYAKRAKVNGFVPSSTKLLEYSSQKYTFDSYRTLLDNSQLGILKLATNVGSHFVVGHGYSTFPTTEIFLKDPYRLTSDSSSIPGAFSFGSITSMRTFTPSNTDLSYLWIFTEPDATVELYRNGDLETNLVCETENIESEADLSPLHLSCSLAKPESGIYKLRIFHPNLALVPAEIYMVDTVSDMKRKEFNGWSFLSQADVEISFNKEQADTGTINRSLSLGGYRELVEYLYLKKYIQQSTYVQVKGLLSAPTVPPSTLLASRHLILKDLDKSRNNPEILKMIQEITRELR